MKLSNSYAEKLRAAFGIGIVEDTELETYCKEHYRLIPNIAYTNKRKINGQSYPIYLNELITPNSWKVAQLKRGLLLTGDRSARIRNVGNTLAKKLVWTDDKNLDSSGDYYLYPSETLTLINADCEDHSFVMTSALPDDLGGSWGFYRKGGHAYNVAIIDGVLWVVDTVGDRVVMVPYEGQSDYVIHFIITPRYTFEVRKGVSFGELAGWED